jgi:hypothetical protein
MRTDLVAFKQVGKWKMPDSLALPSYYIHFLFEVEVVFASELLDCIGSKLSKLER